ncbi:[FeFe] hydrogenase H-cluster radical SAM maturase HydE [Abyssisolibacter fermentans]|uniref:[FeFe] hydrogenase H-cluster radical SAM maturase HydE n=1 Tax=Abyssisolibacter fermentans TaxID=1766203 RepID=UPI0008313329|nr:[FeFe] hydrogenase H-cluster radical SAM maturase HydE [Abyssisolibacter fermentans]
MKQFVDKLFNNQEFNKKELLEFINKIDEETKDYLFEQACKKRDEVYGRVVFFRGLIEFTNYCKSNCYYCGIRRSNNNADRYRLSLNELLKCCDYGYKAGFRTFVLQGGEDAYFTDNKIKEIVSVIKDKYPECAITLSIGEKSYESYKMFFDAGADRFLLRHETAQAAHYKKLHPSEQTLENRKKCLYNLKEIGYQVGAGFMVGSPYQKLENMVEDLMFLKELSPHMVGLGPFIPHVDTPFKDMKAGSVDMTLIMLALVRLILPEVLLPATTALNSIHEKGRELGLKAGANVIMPNLSPKEVREKYTLYNNKNISGLEAAEYKEAITKEIAKIGLKLVVDRGDHVSMK